MQCVSSLVQRLVKVGMSVQLVKMTVYPDDDDDVDDRQGDDASSGSYSERSNWVMMFFFIFIFLPENDWYVKKVKSSSYPYTRWRTRRGVETEGFSTYFYITFNIYILYYF